METTGKQGVGVQQPSGYTAWLILPPGLDRIKFIKKCFLSGTVLVKSVDNEIEKDVQVGISLLHCLKFPVKVGQKGSAVFCVRDPIYRTSKVVAILQDEDEEQLIFEENQFRFHKRNNNTFVDFDAKGNTGDLDITVNSGANEDVESTLNFLNSVNKAKYTVKIQGKYKLTADDTIEFETEKQFKISIKDTDDETAKETIISYTSGVGFILIDEFLNLIRTNKKGVELTTKENKSKIKLNSNGDVTVKCDNAKVDAKKIELGGDATEAVVKGDTFQKLFNAHTHLGNLGAATSTPIKPLDGSELSKISKVE